MQYGLYRIEDDATTTLVSEHEDLLTGIAAGNYAVDVEDFDYAYALHSNSTCSYIQKRQGWLQAMGD